MGEEVECFDDAGHRALAVPMTEQVPIDGQRRPLMVSISTRSICADAVLRPHAATIGAGSEHFAFVIADAHRTGLQNYCRKVSAGGGHDLCGESLVATADEDDGIHGLRVHHLLSVHGH